MINVPREREAIERHIGRMESAHAESRGMDAPHELRHTVVSEAATATAADMPADCDQQQWIQNGTTAQERAERARAVAQAKRQELEKKDQTRLCVFRRGTVSTSTKDQVRPGPKCVFKPRAPRAETTEPLASDASEINKEEPKASSADLSAECQQTEPSAEASDVPEALSTVAQGASDGDEGIATEAPSTYHGQTEPSIVSSATLEVGVSVAHPEPEHDEKHAADLCKLGSPVLEATGKEQQADTSEPASAVDESFAEAAGKEQQADTSEPTPAAVESCPAARVAATAGPHGPRSRLRHPTKFRDTPSASTASTAVPTGGAFGSRSARPCMNSR